MSIDLSQGKFTAFDGYDAASETLIGPRPASGTCLGDDFPNGRTLVYIDTAAPIYSGELALILIEGRNGESNHSVAAYLQTTRRGQWFGQNGTGTMPLSRVATRGGRSASTFRRHQNIRRT